jgi:hypothetical protein
VKVFIVPFASEADPPAEDCGPDHKRLRAVLDSYFDGNHKPFEDEICRESGIDRKLLPVMARIRAASKLIWNNQRLRQISADPVDAPKQPEPHCDPPRFVPP